MASFHCLGSSSWSIRVLYLALAVLQIHGSGVSQDLKRIMRHETTLSERVHSTRAGASAIASDAPADLNWEDFHAFDAGGNCPMVPLIQYPTRYDKKTVKCLDDSTLHLNMACHSDHPTAGENRVMFAYPGKVNTSEFVERFAKVYVPIEGDATRPTEGWPVVILFHATIPLNTADNGKADDAKAPEAHFDGIIHNPDLEDYIEKLITVVPAGYERYSHDGPPCPVEKYTAEFNYLLGSLGRTRHSNADDVKFISSILDWLHESHIVDLANVWVTGHATGAHMVFYMTTQYLYGTEHDGLEFSIKGGAASAGSFLTCLNDPRVAHGDNGDWSHLAPMPFMYFQGLQDISQWCSGGGMYRHLGEHMYSTEQMAFAFAQRNKCGMTPDGGYRLKHWELTPEMDTDLTASANLWEFEDCEAPVVIYTFPALDHILQSVNTFMFKQRFKFFLNEWAAPADGGVQSALNTKNGTNLCGCCSEATGTCDYTGKCDGQQYLQTVSCPGESELTNKCWSSSDLEDNPVCWWVTSDEDGNM